VASTEDDLIEVDEDISVDVPSPEEVTMMGATSPAIPSEVSGQKVGKKKKGPDIHFKENPYTFLSPDDPVLRACT
jgi:multisite-specific tRNA:(cytosine-C5)-methyltransferase